MRRLFLVLALLLSSNGASWAAITKVGVFYAIGTKLVQRIYIPTTNDSEIDQQFILPGEAVLKVPIETYRSGGPVAMQAVVGAPTFSGRCVVVDKITHQVTAVITADPVLFPADPSGNAVIASDNAIIGDTWDGTNFTRRYVEINPHAATALSAVVAVSMQNINTAAPATAGNILMASNVLNVGSAITPSQFLKFNNFP
jgi:hypothetical protein